jgi:RNA polymerase sigma factor (sigma-70 family)
MTRQRMDQQEKNFTELVAENHASIYRICRAYLYDASLADDLYQEILYQVWTSIESYRGAAKVNTWIYRIAINTAINFNLKNKKHQHVSIPEYVQIPYEDTLLQKLEQEDQLDRLRVCISQLEASDRLIISLVLEDKSYRDIAEITGGNINSVGVKINRIKGRLLKLMEKTTHDEL